jgi:hypothetical protein
MSRKQSLYKNNDPQAGDGKGIARDVICCRLIYRPD